MFFFLNDKAKRGELELWFSSNPQGHGLPVKTFFCFNIKIFLSTEYFSIISQENREAV